MTSRKQLKVRVRARMAKTGESYTTALRHLVGPPTLVVDHGYTLRGGLHPKTANIANILAHHDITADGQPIDESLVFGIGGGPGAQYILWEFKQHPTPILTIGFRNQPQYPDAWTQKTLGRLGVRYTVENTSGAVGTARRLTELLAERRPCIIRPELQLIGYWHLPAYMNYCGGHDLVAYAEHDGRVHVDDRNITPLTVDRAAIDAARARVGSYKNSLYVIDPTSGPITRESLREAVRVGLHDCVAHLSSPSDSFSLPTWRKWARLMTDTRNSKSWPRLFADGVGLAGALLSIWEGTTPMGMTGGHLRGFYADFLDQAAALLGLSSLHQPAELFRAAATAWQLVADSALPDAIPELARLRELTAARRETVADPADSTPDETAQVAAELWTLRGRLDRQFPIDSPAISDLFATLGAAISDVYERETAAVAALARAIGPPKD